MDEQCYVYGKIPATPGYESSPKIGFIAHMDTVSDFCDHEIVPVLHPDYDGKDLVLGESGRTLEVSAFPHLPELKRSYSDHNGRYDCAGSRRQGGYR